MRPDGAGHVLLGIISYYRLKKRLSKKSSQLGGGKIVTVVSPLLFGPQAAVLSAIAKAVAYVLA
jgi:hypothetical protein